MTRMTGPDCVVMCNLINIHTHTHTHTLIINLSIISWREIVFKTVFHTGTFNMLTSYTNSGCGKERRTLIGPW